MRNVDGRTKEARVVKQTITEVTDQLGGDPTATQRILIHATAVLVLRIRCALDRYASGDGNVESLDRHVCSLQNALRLNLMALGLERAKDAGPTLAAYLEARRAA